MDTAGCTRPVTRFAIWRGAWVLGLCAAVVAGVLVALGGGAAPARAAAAPAGMHASASDTALARLAAGRPSERVQVIV